MARILWQSVPGYEGLYEVSDQGQVQSLPRPGTTAGGILKPYIRKDGYAQVVLYKDGVPENFLVHKLVLLTFVGPCPEDMESLHGPSGKSDNSLTNLCYGTHIANEADKLRDGNHARGENTKAARATWDIVRRIRYRYSMGVTMQALATEYGLGKTTIQNIVNRRTWREVV